MICQTQTEVWPKIDFFSPKWERVFDQSNGFKVSGSLGCAIAPCLLAVLQTTLKGRCCLCSFSFERLLTVHRNLEYFEVLAFCALVTRRLLVSG
jgi:hypothetical protein